MRRRTRDAPPSRTRRPLVLALVPVVVLGGLATARTAVASGSTASSRSTAATGSAASGSTAAGDRPAATATAAGGDSCRPGAHTLGSPGDHVYPDTGNGGYRSLHTNVDMVYDATTNRFLHGNNVELTDRATQCLTSLSLDFERSSADKLAGPDMKVGAVTVDGAPASWTFVQPTYPGDPAGASDPDPAAHEASQNDPVGGPAHNPLPPACSPQVTSTAASQQDSDNGEQCPADKLVITPGRPIHDGARFTVTVDYAGRPGVHHDGDGTTEGWFRSGDGGFVTTEPVGSEDWMPLNDFPTAKPTYDFYDTVSYGKQAIANGILESQVTHGPNREFPDGSVTFHWHAAAPVASYLVEDSVGDYTLTRRVAAHGLIFYEAQDTSIPAAQQAKNLEIMNLQANITAFESTFNGPFPFTSDGVIIGTPPASFEEEMETMITFAGGTIGTSVLYHENMHQWWGDHVTESGYDMTFYKEGLATLAQSLYAARQAQETAGGPGVAAGRRAFEASLIQQFDQVYAGAGAFWTGAPSNPTPYSLFASYSTYDRPLGAYLALRQILGATDFDHALQQMQRLYGGGNIDEAQLEAAFHRWLPHKSPACGGRLDTFFREWFDTAYPGGGGTERPQVTGPGLDGPGFYSKASGCVR